MAIRAAPWRASVLRGPLWLFGGGAVFEGRRGHGAAPSSGSLKSAPGYLGPFPLFGRTYDRDHEKFSNEFKRRAALFFSGRPGRNVPPIPSPRPCSG
jgi:hypothetical protein